MFYLSFENALCTDYITEKAFSMYKRLIIPVVFGAANYSRLLPPHSYIDVNNFSNSKKLANYLIYVSKNPKVYLSYFWWQKYYKMFEVSPFCGLCKILHKPKYQKHYSNIRKWWTVNDCRHISGIKF